MKSGLWCKCARVLAVWCGSAVLSVSANEGGGDAFKDGINYLPIKPPLVVNYGGTGKIKYIKAEISLRVEDKTRAEEVAHHMPLVRDTLIMLISSVTDEQMASGEGKEKMRQDALHKLNEVLAAAIHPGGHADAKAEPAKKAAKAEHAKDEKAKGDAAKDEAAADEHSGLLVSDLLFDNLVVQK